MLTIAFLGPTLLGLTWQVHNLEPEDRICGRGKS